MTLPHPGDDRFYPPRSFMAPPHPYGEYDRSRVVILPVFYDSTTTVNVHATVPSLIVSTLGEKMGER